MRLSGKQVGQIQDALLAAFPSKDALRMMVRLELDAQLDEIAGGDNLRVVIFNLVNWAEQTGRESNLIQGAYRQNEGNPKLQQLVKDAQAWFPSAASTPIGGSARSAGATRAPASVDIFLSYSRQDSDAMRRVQDDLRGAGFAVWIDEGLEAGTQSWRAAIGEAISQVQAMVVLLSPDAKASNWVDNEVAYAQTLGKRIFPVLVSGDAASAVPISLINAQWVDGRENLRQAVTQTLLPALRRHLLMPESSAPVQRPPVKAEATVPAGLQSKPRSPYFWVVLIVVAFIVGVLGYYFLDRLLFSPQLAAPTSVAINSTPPSTAALPTLAPTLAPTTSTATQTSSTKTTDAPSAATTPEAGAIRTNPQDGAEYVYVPAGEFLMGSDKDTVPSDFGDEMPQHTVDLSGFWIMRSEVTNAQYALCVEAGRCTEPDNTDWTDAAYADHPVTNVDWSQANAYAEWAGGRLPTEAQWEKACRGTDGAIYPWGDEPPSPERLNYAYNVDTTTAVGGYPAGANGLYDMAGNVWEWTADWYGENYYADSPQHNPTGPEEGAFHTLRGGSWDVDDDHYVRCAVRNANTPDYRNYYDGFRVSSSGS